MPEQINNQAINNPILPVNQEIQLVPKTKIESNEDGIKYDRFTVDKVKDALLRRDSSTGEVIKFVTGAQFTEDFQPAFDLLEISQASSVQDVIDKMHSDNYDKESLDLKLNSFARAIYEVAQKSEESQQNVLGGPFLVENSILKGSKVTKGIGEKVVAFVTTNSELRYPMDFLDELTSGFGQKVGYSSERISTTVAKVKEYIRFAKNVNSLKDERAKLDMINFLDTHFRPIDRQADEEIKETRYEKERLNYLERNTKKNYEEAIVLIDNILTPREAYNRNEKTPENKSIIPYIKKQQTEPHFYKHGESDIYTTYIASVLNQEGVNISINFNIRDSGIVTITQEKVKDNSPPERTFSEFPFADIRGATQSFIDTYNGYKK